MLRAVRGAEPSTSAPPPPASPGGPRSPRGRRRRGSTPGCGGEEAAALLKRESPPAVGSASGRRACPGAAEAAVRGAGSRRGRGPVRLSRGCFWRTDALAEPGSLRRRGEPYLSLASAARSRCRRFLNQLLTWVVVRPVASASSRFSLRLQPELLQLGVVVRRKLVALQDLVELAEVAPVEGHHRLGLQDALVLVEVLAGREGPEEPPQPLDVAALLEHLADAGHLLLGEAKSREHRHAVRPSRKGDVKTCCMDLGLRKCLLSTLKCSHWISSTVEVQKWERFLAKIDQDVAEIHSPTPSHPSCLKGQIFPTGILMGNGKMCVQKDPTSLHGLTQLHRRTGKKQRQFWVSGEHVLDYNSETFTLTVLDCPSVDVL
ncbi:uncharacterized protein ACIBXB_001332 [Morphnus guianensis]